MEKWKRGKTGYPLVDAAMRQMYEIGWMHNRLRMVTGSFLVKHLRIIGLKVKNILKIHCLIMIQQTMYQVGNG